MDDKAQIFFRGLRDSDGTVLPADCAALTASPKGEMVLLMPGGEDDELPPPMVFLMAVFLRAAEDPAFRREMMSWADQRIERDDRESADKSNHN
jgi:hypothetical protein